MINSETSKHVFNDLENIHIDIKMKYINGNIIEQTFIYHKQLDKLIQHTFSRILNRCASLKGGYYQNKMFPLFYVGNVFNLCLYSILTSH